MKSENWIGYYIFGWGYYLPLFGTREPFELKVTYNESEFTGHSIEAVHREFDEFPVMEVVGYFEEDYIRFTKFCNKINVVDENGERSIEKGKMQIDYEGYFDKKQNLYLGNWNLYVNEEEDVSGSGLWLMKENLLNQDIFGSIENLF